MKRSGVPFGDPQIIGKRTLDVSVIRLYGINGSIRQTVAPKGPVRNAEFLYNVAVSDQNRHRAAVNGPRNGLGHRLFPDALGHVKILKIAPGVPFENLLHEFPVFGIGCIDLLGQILPIVGVEVFQTADGDLGRNVKGNIQGLERNTVVPNIFQNLPVQSEIVFPVCAPVGLLQEGLLVQPA